MKSNIKTHLRIIWAIASKDIFDAIKNKTVLGIMVGIAVLMLSSQALPLILKVNNEPRAFYYDSGKSTKIREIVRSREIKLNPVDSLQDMKIAVGSSSVPVLGLVIPPDFDREISGNSPIYLEGYCIHWAKPSETEDLITHFENTLSRLTGHTIQIQLTDENVYPDPEELGFSSMVITGLITGVMTIGLILVPLLITEEIENHTMEALIISPAKTWHLLIGKSITGFFYSLIAAIVMIVFTNHWIVHWEVAIPAVVLGAFSAVSLGLLLGSLSNDQTTINLLAGISVVVLLIPAFLRTTIHTGLGFPLKTLIQVLPSVPMSNLIFASFLKTIGFQDIWLNFAILIIFIMAVLGLVHWLIRKTDP